MKALIFNSGLGRRLGDLTKNNPKCMLKLNNGETIFERQIRILSECGIKEFIITTGPFHEQLLTITQQNVYRCLKFHFIKNDHYESTNYIYSFYLTKSYIDDDLLILHGDLVFDKNLIKYILKHENSSICLINKLIDLPEKDFKARIIGDKLTEVSISIFDKNCYAFQPLYKLNKSVVGSWIHKVTEYIEIRKIKNVYAEDALNEILCNIAIKPISYEDFYIAEIDDFSDYKRVSEEIRLFDFKEQEIFTDFSNVYEILKINNIKKPFLIVDKYLLNNDLIKGLVEILDVDFFTDFTPNPTYNNVVKAREKFISSYCDAIISVGGGSAIDVAKTLKLFLPLNDHSDQQNFLEQEKKYINLKHIAIPTTAGTGSESTRYSVIYYNNEKQSLEWDFLLPDYVILENSFILTLPLNHKIYTLFDALCQSIESIWSINSNQISKAYSKESISLILSNIERYLNGDNSCNSLIQKAANLSGKAINITQTTLAHAMSYKLTSDYKIPHGLAVAICLPETWTYLVENVNHITETDKRTILKENLDFLNILFNCSNSQDSILYFKKILKKYIEYPDIRITIDELTYLSRSVNTTRLKNYPINIEQNNILMLYSRILYIDKFKV